MTRLVLTLAQARDLQHHLITLPDEQQTQWGDWAFAVQPEREKADTLGDPERMTIALAMKSRDCTDEQIAMQLGWKPASNPLRQVERISRKALP